MADPEISKRNARRNYKTTANEEFDAADERKKSEGAGAQLYSKNNRNSAGDTMGDWLDQSHQRRMLGYNVDSATTGSRIENLKSGYYGQEPKFAKGGMVKKGSYTTPSMASNSKVIRSRSK